VNLLPGANLGTNLGTPVVLPGQKITRVVDKKRMGDRGFEPLTLTVCRLDRKKRKRRKLGISPVKHPLFRAPGLRWI